MTTVAQMFGPIVIHTDLDLTPKGKRVAKVVKTDRGGSQIRWYVGGTIYRRLPVTQANKTLSRQWVEAA